MRQFYLLMNWTLFPLLGSIMTYETKAHSNDPNPDHGHIPDPVQPDGLGWINAMIVIINDIVVQIDQIIF